MGPSVGDNLDQLRLARLTPDKERNSGTRFEETCGIKTHAHRRTVNGNSCIENRAAMYLPYTSHLEAFTFHMLK